MIKLNYEKQVFIKELNEIIEFVVYARDRTRDADSWGSNRCKSQIMNLSIAKKKIETALEILKLVSK